MESETKHAISVAAADRALAAYENGGYEEETYPWLLMDLLTDLLHKFGEAAFDASLANARRQYRTEPKA